MRENTAATGQRRADRVRQARGLSDLASRARGPVITRGARLSPSPSLYTVSKSFSVHTLLVNPASIAGVHLIVE